jgi:HNH endonuclease/NUMOD4 motif
LTWVALEGYEGIYAISDDGQVMSMNYKKSNLPGIMTLQIRRGYLSAYLCKKGEKERWGTVHTLVAHHFIGPRPHGLTINHKNGIKTDNRVENLEYCTASENSKHSFTTGAQCNKGIKHSQHKFTDDQIRDIRTRNLNGESQTAIAKSLGVSQSAIHLVVRRKRWDHVH